MALSCSKKSISIIKIEHYGNFYYLNFLYSFRTKTKLESHKKVCENKDSSNVIMPSENTKISYSGA